MGVRGCGKDLDNLVFSESLVVTSYYFISLLPLPVLVLLVYHGRQDVLYGQY